MKIGLFQSEHMRHNWGTIVLTAAALVLGGCMGASGLWADAPSPNTVLHCGYTEAAPNIDGNPADAVWRLAGTAVDFLELSPTRTLKVAKQTVVYALWSKDTLYLAAMCEEPEPGKLVRNPANKAYSNDCVEFFIAPAGTGTYYQFSLDTLPSNLYDDRNGDAGFKSNAKTANNIGASSWSVEMAVPFSAFGKAPKAGDAWRINIGREDRVSHKLSTWAPTDRFNNISNFGTIKFVGAAAATQRRASHFGIFDEILVNADFDPGKDENALPRGWVTSPTRVRVNEIMLQSQKWELVSKPGVHELAEQSVRLQPAAKYALRARIRGGDGAIAEIVLRESVAGRQAVRTLISAKATRDFRELSATFVANGTDARISLFNAAQNGWVSCDFISLRRSAPRPFVVASLGIPPQDMPATKPLVTDHIPWAKPLRGGPIRAFFSMRRNYNGARDFVELAQRVDLDYDVVVGGKGSETYERVNRRLAYDEYDVFVLPAMDYPRDLKDLIAKRVQAGRGLVVVENVVNYAANILGKHELQAVGDDHYLRRDLPFDDLPEILQGIDAGEVGKGRAVVLRFDRDKSYFYNVWPAERLEPRYKKRENRYWAGWHALLARAIVWAARRDTAYAVSCEVRGRTISVKLTPAAQQATLDVHVRSARELRFDGSMLPAVKASGNAEVTVELTSGFPDGAVLVDAWARDADGAVRYWACKPLQISQRATIEQCCATQEYFGPEEEAKATVTVRAHDACDGILDYYVCDAWQRRLTQHRIPAKLAPGQSRTFTLALNLSRTLSTCNRLFARFIVNGREADSCWTYIYLPHVTRGITDRDWHVTSWGASYCSLPIFKYYCDMLRDIGVNDQMGGYGTVENGMCGGRCEAPPRFLFDSYVTGGEKDRSNARKPCLSDPDTRKKIQDECTEYARSVRKYGLHGIYIAGEAMLCAGTVGMHEVCFSPHCQARYRQWLKQRYGTIEKLNAQWDTEYAGFGECAGMLTADARKRKNVAPFVDFREFMTEVWIDALRLAADTYRTRDPGLRVGYTHCFGAVPLGGTDFYRLARDVGFGWGQEYPECRKPQARYAAFMIWRSFSPDDWPNLSWSGYDHSFSALMYEPWWLALHGSRGMSYHQVNSLAVGRSYAVIFPTLAYTEASYAIRDALKDLVDGLGKVFMEFEAHQPRIGILWSYPSLTVAWCESDLDYWQANEGANDKSYGTWYKSAFYFRLLCEDLQLDYRYVAPEQILKENALKRFDLIFLPMTIAASPKLINAIEKFVKDGGTVIGDFRCLRTNGRGKPYPLRDQPLEKLFGVRRTSDTLIYGPRSITFHRKAEEVALQGKGISGFCAEPLEVAAGARALASHKDGLPAVIVNKIGKGQAIYINMVLPKYHVVARELLRQVLAMAGVRRDIIITGQDRSKPPRAYEVKRFSRDGNEVVCIIRDFRLCGSEPPVQIDFGRQAHVYDVRGRKYLGRTRTIRATIRPAETKAYALFPYRVTGIKLGVPEKAQAGVDLSFAAELESDARTLGAHVFHIEVLRPDGKDVYPYCVNVPALGGRFSGSVPLALNDASGAWKLTVRDVLTGTSDQAQFTVVENAE